MSEKTKLIVIAGPQSSGKTTIMKLLEKKYPHIPFIEEINPFTIISRNHLGGAYVDAETERKITDANIEKIKTIDQSQSAVFMETGILHTTYAEYYSGRETAEIYLKKYIKAHEGLHPIVFFIDTKPQISWERRRSIYLRRINNLGVKQWRERMKMLQKYRNTIVALYPLWHKYFHLIPFEKYIIKNSYKKWNVFEREIMEKVKALLVNSS